MLTRFVDIRNELIQASSDNEGSIPINRSTAFSTKVKKSATILSEINTTTVNLQTRYYTLANCRDDIDFLMQNIEEAEPDERLFNCSLGDSYLKVDTELSNNPDFESGVVKIQRRKADTMTGEEKRATSALLKPGIAVSTTASVRKGATMREKYNKRRKVDPNYKYMCTDFILGSAAAVERLWSSAKHILSNERSKLKPLVFEAIMFLKYNERFWGEQLVAEAMRNPISERTRTIILELNAQSAILFNGNEE